MKRLVIITTYCDTQEKLDIFAENIRKIKKLGLDILAIGPSEVEIPHTIVQECDFFFYTKENPIIEFPVINYTHWFLRPIDERKRIMIHRGYGSYDWASLYQIKKLLQIGLTYDYDSYCNIIYDLIITEEMEKKLLSEEVNIMHKRFSPSDGSLVDSAHFMFLDRNTAALVEREIDYEAFLYANVRAEDHVKMWVDKFNLRYVEPHIRDKIYYWKDHQNHFDYEIHPDFKFFFSKNPDIEIWVGGNDNPRKEILKSNIRMIFYDFANPNIRQNGLIIAVDEDLCKIHPQEWEIVELPVSSQHAKTIRIIYEHEILDITKVFAKTKYNLVYEDTIIT